MNIFQRKVGTSIFAISKQKVKCYMEKEYYDALAQVRLERAKELLVDAKDLLEKQSYKSANNRAFYTMEKCMKALLALVQKDVTTHNGALKQFNFFYVYHGDGTFLAEDYQKVARAEQIRNASDYDDFYIACKEETKIQIENAEEFLKKVDNYITRRKNE